MTIPLNLKLSHPTSTVDNIRVLCWQCSAQDTFAREMGYLDFRDYAMSKGRPMPWGRETSSLHGLLNEVVKVVIRSLEIWMSDASLGRNQIKLGWMMMWFTVCPDLFLQEAITFAHLKRQSHTFFSSLHDVAMWRWDRESNDFFAVAHGRECDVV